MDEKTRARAEALSNVLRLEIITVLLRGPASASEIAEEIEVPADKVRHQLRRLRDQGFVDEVDTRYRRGTVEKFYMALDGEVALDNDERTELPEYLKRTVDAGLVQIIFRQALRALRAGTMSASRDATLVNFPMAVDAEGWDELAALHDETLERLQGVRDRNRERLRVSGEDPIPTTSVAMLFALPTSTRSVES